MSQLPHFSWKSSYAGLHDYEVVFGDRSTGCLTARNFVPSRGAYQHMTDDQFNLSIEGQLGFYSVGNRELMTLEFCAAFAAQCYKERNASVAKVMANPKLNGGYMPKKFTVMLPAIYDKEAGWKALFSFEEIIKAAGIPAEDCIVLARQ